MQRSMELMPNFVLDGASSYEHSFVHTANFAYNGFVQPPWPLPMVNGLDQLDSMASAEIVVHHSLAPESMTSTCHLHCSIEYPTLNGTMARSAF